MTKIRILHLSDIHFGQEVDGTRVEQEDIRAGLVTDCRAMKQNLGAVNGIVVTGDIAYAGKPTEYDRAGIWLDELCEAVGCDRMFVHTIPGNHDIDRDEIDYTVELLHKQLRDCAPEDVNQTLARIAGRDPNVTPIGLTALYGKLAAYREFANRYQSDFESERRPVSAKVLQFPTGHKLRFVGFTSVQVSDRYDVAQKMVLGSQQYVIKEEPNVECVVMCHHPFDWFKDEAQAMPRIRTRGRLILTGHEHQPAYKKIIEAGVEYLMLDAGAANPPGNEPRSPHCYNWIEFELLNGDGTFSLDVRVYPRIWLPNFARFGADTNRVNGAVSESYQVKCPNYQPIAAADAPAPSPEPPRPIGVSEEEEAATMSDDERFARLLYFFWRYLNWQERYSVLSKVEILPKGPERPMPQVLERNALATARKQDKLASVWDEVMKFVPADEQEQNPF